MIRNLKENLNVWSLVHGEGHILEIGQTSLTCLFKNGMQAHFTKDGRLFDVSAGNQVLFFSEPKISALFEPQQHTSNNDKTAFNPQDALEMKSLISNPIDFYAYTINEFYSLFKEHTNILKISLNFNNLFFPFSKNHLHLSIEYNDGTVLSDKDDILTLRAINNLDCFNIIYETWIEQGKPLFAAALLISREEYPIGSPCDFENLNDEVKSKLNQETLNYFLKMHAYS